MDTETKALYIVSTGSHINYTIHGIFLESTVAHAFKRELKDARVEFETLYVKGTPIVYTDACTIDLSDGTILDKAKITPTTYDGTLIAEKEDKTGKVLIAHGTSPEDAEKRACESLTAYKNSEKAAACK